MHEPVLLAPTIDLLEIKPNGNYVDCTFGRGGHTSAVLSRLNEEGRVLAIDRDVEAIEYGNAAIDDERLSLVHAAFSQLDDVLADAELSDQIDGVLMDLGVSSPQLDDPERGFSFRADGPLDMRMDVTRGVSATDWIAVASEREIKACLKELGEERFSGRIARRIVESRNETPIRTTAELAAIVRGAVPRRDYKIDPATRTFQALRIQVNAELEELTAALKHATRHLRPGGRAAVIAFHSLEDRIVKRFFRNLQRDSDNAAGTGDNKRFRVVTRKPLRPDEAEVKANPRARSARLRVLECVA